MRSKRLLQALNWNLEPVLLSSLAVSAALTVLSRVIARAVFWSDPPPWTGELARYLLIWTVYLGISYADLTGRHVRITFFLSLFPEKPRKILSLTGDFLNLGYGLLIVFYGIGLNLDAGKYRQVSPYLGIAMVFVYLSIVFGFSLHSLRVIQLARHKLRNWDAGFSAFERIPKTPTLFDKIYGSQ